MERICNACGKGFTIPKQRGRPALKCEACRGAKPRAYGLDDKGMPVAKPNAAVSALLSDPSILKDPAKLRELAAKLETKPTLTENEILSRKMMEGRIEAPKPVIRKGRVFTPVAELPKPEPIVAPIEVGSRVRVKAREWRGIHRPGFSGKLVSWERDSKGIYAVVEHRGDRVLARPENVKAA